MSTAALSSELADINFEKTSTLFNLAAIQSQIGAMANCTSDDGLKTAAKNFQGAATAFEAVAAVVHKHYTTPPSSDLDPTLLHALSQLMLVRVGRGDARGVGRREREKKKDGADADP